MSLRVLNPESNWLSEPRMQEVHACTDDVADTRTSLLCERDYSHARIAMLTHSRATGRWDVRRYASEHTQMTNARC
eukprot:scaffold8955_cov38-Tisochrysis_lutea.AAC.2